MPIITHDEFIESTEAEDDLEVLTDLTYVNVPVFRVWNADPRKSGDSYHYRTPIADAYTELLAFARRNPRITVIRNARGLPAQRITLSRPS